MEKAPALHKRSALCRGLLYLDNDDTGSAASRKLFENAQDASKLVDMRSYYAGYEGFNVRLLRVQIANCAPFILFYFLKIESNNLS